MSIFPTWKPSDTLGPDESMVTRLVFEEFEYFMQDTARQVAAVIDKKLDVWETERSVDTGKKPSAVEREFHYGCALVALVMLVRNELTEKLNDPEAKDTKVMGGLPAVIATNCVQILEAALLHNPTRESISTMKEAVANARNQRK